MGGRVAGRKEKLRSATRPCGEGDGARPHGEGDGARPASEEGGARPALTRDPSEHLPEKVGSGPLLPFYAHHCRTPSIECGEGKRENERVREMG